MYNECINNEDISIYQLGQKLSILEYENKEELCKQVVQLTGDLGYNSINDILNVHNIKLSEYQGCPLNESRSIKENYKDLFGSDINLFRIEGNVGSGDCLFYSIASALNNNIGTELYSVLDIRKYISNYINHDNVDEILDLYISVVQDNDINPQTYLSIKKKFINDRVNDLKDHVKTSQHWGTDKDIMILSEILDMNILVIFNERVYDNRMLVSKNLVACIGNKSDKFILIYKDGNHYEIIKKHDKYIFNIEDIPLPIATSWKINCEGEEHTQFAINTTTKRGLLLCHKRNDTYLPEHLKDVDVKWTITDNINNNKEFDIYDYVVYECISREDKEIVKMINKSLELLKNGGEIVIYNYKSLPKYFIENNYSYQYLYNYIIIFNEPPSKKQDVISILPPNIKPQESPQEPELPQQQQQPILPQQPILSQQPILPQPVIPVPQESQVPCIEQDLVKLINDATVNGIDIRKLLCNALETKSDSEFGGEKEALIICGTPDKYEQVLYKMNADDAKVIEVSDKSEVMEGKTYDVVYMCKSMDSMDDFMNNVLEILKFCKTGGECVFNIGVGSNIIAEKMKDMGYHGKIRDYGSGKIIIIYNDE